MQFDLRSVRQLTAQDVLPEHPVGSRHPADDVGATGAIPNRAFITAFPTPRPRMNRPSDAWSSWAAVLAVSTGGRSAAFAIAVPTRTRRVAAATGWQSDRASPCPSATNTAPKPARSAASASARGCVPGAPGSARRTRRPGRGSGSGR